MNYYKYYSSPDKFSARTYRVQISGHLLPDDDQVVVSQSLNIRATHPEEAYHVSSSVRDSRLNRLYTTAVVTDLQGQSLQTWKSGPLKPELTDSFEQDVKVYSVVIVREAGANPLTGVWSNYAEDHLTIHATSEQQAHHIADFVSALPFSGQTKRTFINSIENFDERF